MVLSNLMNKTDNKNTSKTFKLLKELREIQKDPLLSFFFQPKNDSGDIEIKDDNLECKTETVNNEEDDDKTNNDKNNFLLLFLDKEKLKRKIENKITKNFFFDRFFFKKENTKSQFNNIDENLSKKRSSPIDEDINNNEFTNKKTKLNFSKKQDDVSNFVDQHANKSESNKNVLEHNLSYFYKKKLENLKIICIPEDYPFCSFDIVPLTEIYHKIQSSPLYKHLSNCHKVLNTENYNQIFLEGKIAFTYSRIEELKKQNKLSSRFPKKYIDPFLNLKNKKFENFYWDYLLEEVKWMATDFKESSKLKKATCVNLSNSLNAYWDYGDDVFVKFKKINHISNKVLNLDFNLKKLKKTTNDLKTGLEFFHFTDSNENVENTKSEDKSKNEIKSKPFFPFNLQISFEVLNKIDKTIIKSLPFYTPFQTDSLSSNISMNDRQFPSYSVSRLFTYNNENPYWFNILFKETVNTSKQLPNFKNFIFSNVTDEHFLHLKPPKPPQTKNIEYNTSTIWLPLDDKKLIHYVFEFCFNWDLVAEHLLFSNSSLKKYESVLERRTPWQCFERYIQLNSINSLHDLKGAYSYQAHKWLKSAQKFQIANKKKITPLGIDFESIQRGHRKLRWITMFDVINKKMRKSDQSRNVKDPLTETSKMLTLSNLNTNHLEIEKQIEKAPTPLELSILKFEKDK